MKWSTERVAERELCRDPEELDIKGRLIMGLQTKGDRSIEFVIGTLQISGWSEFHSQQKHCLVFHPKDCS